MAFDSWDIVIPPDYGDHLCVDCARALMPEHPDWDDPEDENGNMRPVFNTDEVSCLVTCGRCGYISTYGSFGPEAVDYGIEMLRQWLRDQSGNTDYLDVYAERLSSCCLGSGYEGARGEIVVRRYRELRKEQTSV